jgi:predicted DNA-binding transcriptional regulator AlpA
VARKGKGGGGELLTLKEVGERTGISMPSLLRYKKEHQARIPSVGEGRTQRYPVAALAVFEEIKRENLSKRGRPKGPGPARGRGAAAKSAGGGRRKAAAAGDRAEGGGGELLTLTEVGERTGISYPTLRRYADEHADRIPSEGEGRRRRYRPEAVAVFQEIRGGSRPGRKPVGGRRQAKEGGEVARPGSSSAAGGRRPAGGGQRDGGSGELDRRLADLQGRQDRLRLDLERAFAVLQKPVEAKVSWSR